MYVLYKVTWHRYDIVHPFTSRHYLNKRHLLTGEHDGYSTPRLTLWVERWVRHRIIGKIKLTVTCVSFFFMPLFFFLMLVVCFAESLFTKQLFAQLSFSYILCGSVHRLVSCSFFFFFSGGRVLQKVGHFFIYKILKRPFAIWKSSQTVTKRGACGRQTYYWWSIKIKQTISFRNLLLKQANANPPPLPRSPGAELAPS